MKVITCVYPVFKMKILLISFSIAHVRPISDIDYHELTMGSTSLQYDNLRKLQKFKHVFKYIKDSKPFLDTISLYFLSMSPYPNPLPSSIVFHLFFLRTLVCYICKYIYPFLHTVLIRSCNVRYCIRQKDVISLIVTCVWSLLF